MSFCKHSSLNVKQMLFSMISISRGWNLSDSLEKRQIAFKKLHCMCKLIIVVWSPCSLAWVKPPGNSQSWVIMLWKNTINRNAHECFHCRDIKRWTEVTHDPFETWIASLAAGRLDRNNKTNFDDQQNTGETFPHLKLALPELSGDVLQLCPLSLQMHLDLHPLIKAVSWYGVGWAEPQNVELKPE